VPSTSSVDAVVDFVCKGATELESSSKVCLVHSVGVTVHVVFTVRNRIELAGLKMILGAY